MYLMFVPKRFNLICITLKFRVLKVGSLAEECPTLKLTTQFKMTEKIESMTFTNSNYDQEDATTEQTTNVQFHEARDTQAEHLDPEEAPTHDNSEASALMMPEKTFNYTTITQRKRKIWSGLWKITDNETHAITKLVFPNVLYTIPNYASILNTFSYARFGLRFTIMVQGTPFHKGLLAAVWQPLTMHREDSGMYHSVISMLPHTMTQAQATQSSVLDIPFNFQRPWYHLQGVTHEEETIGALYLTPFNILESSGDCTSTTLPVSIFVELVKPEYHVPTAKLPAQATVRAERQSFIQDASKAFSAGKGIVDAIGGNGNIGDAIMNGIGTAADLGLKYGLELDKPSEEVVPYDVKKRNMCVPAYTQGVDTSVRLATSYNSCHLVNPTLVGSKANDHNFGKVLKTPSFIGRVPWSPDLAEGTVLYATDVTPLLASTYTIFEQPFIQHTYLSYASSAFLYYRGGIKFRFQLVKTKFHAGRLAVYFFPGTMAQFVDPLAPNPVPKEDYSMSPYAIFDVSQKNEFEITLPYNREMEWLRVHGPKMFKTTGDTDLPIVALEDILKPTLHECFLGTLKLVVFQNIVKPCNVPTDAAINVYIAGADDFELAVPAVIRPAEMFGELSRAERQADVEKLEENATRVAQPDTTTAEENVNIMQRTDARQDAPLMQYGIKTAKFRPMHHFVGEKYTNINDLIRRSTMIGKVVYNLTATERRLYINVPNTPWIRTTDIDAFASVPPKAPRIDAWTPNSWLSYFAQLYLMWSGSIRYKFINRTDNKMFQSVYHVAGYTYSVDADDEGISAFQTDDLGSQLPRGMACDMIDHAQNNVMEVEIPFYNTNSTCRVPYHSQNTAREPHLFHAGRVLYTIDPVGDNTEAKGSIIIMQSAGDDFKFHTLIPPPLARYNDFVNTSEINQGGFYYREGQL